eukprot:gene4898-5541_t
MARPRDDSPDFTRGDLSLEEQSPIEGGIAQPAPVTSEFLEHLGPLLHDLAGTVRQSAEMQADSNAQLGRELRDCISQPRVKAGARTQKTVTPESQVAELLANLVKTNKTKFAGQPVSAFQSNSFSKPDDFFEMKKELREIRESLARLNEQGDKKHRDHKFDGPNQQKKRFEMRQTQGPHNDRYQPGRNSQGQPVCYRCGGLSNTSRSCLAQFQQTPGWYPRPNGYGNSENPRNNFYVNVIKGTEFQDRHADNRMQNDLQYISKLARDGLGKLEKTCQFLDKNTRTAYHSYEQIRNSNRATKAKMKEAMARLTQLKKVLRSRMDQELDEAINRSLQEVLEMDIDFLAPNEPNDATQDESDDSTQDDADKEQDDADEEQNHENTQSGND